MNALFAGIRWRLVAWIMLVVGLILVVLGSIVYAATFRTLRDEADRDLASRAEQAVVNPRAFLSGQGDLERARYLGGVFYLVVSADGRVRENPQNVDVSSIALPASLSQGNAYATITMEGAQVRLYSLGIQPGGPNGPTLRRGPFPFESKERQSAIGPGDRPPPTRFEMNGAFLVVGQSLVPEQQALASLLFVLVAGGGIGLILSFVGAWFLAGRALVPIAQAFQRQQQFVADASHELRTPLTVLRSVTDLLNQHRNEPLEANGVLFDDLRQEIGRLQRLASDLLTLARSDRDQLDLAVAPMDIGTLAGDVVRRAMPLAAENGIDLSIDRHDESSIVEMDPDRIQQVLLILLDNAIKYTPSGGRVTVAVRRQENNAIIEIVDSGAGIPPEHLPRLFERFYRGDSARSRKQGGIGLGLAIAKTLVDAHGGELTLLSNDGGGTRARIRLPAETNEQMPPVSVPGSIPLGGLDRVHQSSGPRE